MDARTKELVALSASVAARCQPCFRHHLSKARELGIGEDEINNVVELARRISDVGNERMIEFVQDVMKKEE